MSPGTFGGLRKCSKFITALILAGAVAGGASANDRTLQRCRHHHGHRYCRRHGFHRTRVHWSHAYASWYNAAGGPIACGGDSYAMGVASRTLPCGTRLVVCYRGCVRAVVFDYGPAAWTGRDMDLSRQVKDAIGFPGLGTVRYRLRRG